MFLSHSLNNSIITVVVYKVYSFPIFKSFFLILNGPIIIAETYTSVMSLYLLKTDSKNNTNSCPEAAEGPGP